MNLELHSLQQNDVILRMQFTHKSCAGMMSFKERGLCYTSGLRQVFVAPVYAVDNPV
jgi:hypothetical protein